MKRFYIFLPFIFMLAACEQEESDARAKLFIMPNADEIDTTNGGNDL